MSNELHVEPVEGRMLPIETAPTRHITKRCFVPNRSYYRRAINRGDIRIVTEAKSKRTSKPKTGSNVSEEG